MTADQSCLATNVEQSACANHPVFATVLSAEVLGTESGVKSGVDWQVSQARKQLASAANGRRRIEARKDTRNGNVPTAACVGEPRSTASISVSTFESGDDCRSSARRKQPTT